MKKYRALKSALAGGASAFVLATAAYADQFNIPAGDLAIALNAYTQQTGVDLIVAGDAVRGVRTHGVTGDLTADVALARILSGTGFATRRQFGAIAVVHEDAARDAQQPLRIADAAPVKMAAAASVETVVVTSSKIKGDIQTVPIAITALSQEQLTSRQIAGGPDLVKEVPNLTFSKTNFSGYNLQIRGIGTQAISVTTDPAVAVALNDIPFIRNHFFEQEFYDVAQVEVLRGPQGTLYGRNATAGVVNLASAKATDQWEAMASIDVGNYNNRRVEGMVNVPLIGDKLDVRVAGEWTKRDGYTFDETTDSSVDGRNLWSSRVTVGFHPIENLHADLVWEHFSEDDDRLRSAKTLCTTDPGPSSIDGPSGLVSNIDISGHAYLSQGCSPGSLYAPAAFQAPNAISFPFISAAEFVYNEIPQGFDPYGGVQQSRSLRVIGSALKPGYQAKNDTVELNATYDITSSLTLTSQTGFNKDNLYSTEDFNRFNTVPGAFNSNDGSGIYTTYGNTPVGDDHIYCDPQLGCSDRLLGEDVSQEHAEQFSQEVRLASNFDGPFNFSIGASYLRYHTVEDYFVFFNAISLITENQNAPHVIPFTAAPHISFDGATANSCGPVEATADMDFSGSLFGVGCAYVDPNPLSQIDGNGHNYFRSQNPYSLHSWAGFGEAYYQLTPEVKLTGGLRWTDDRKSFTEIPSWAFVIGKGYPITGILDQQWKEWTGRFNATWSPKLDFTDESLFYASYARGYKGGGANPPGVVHIVEFGIPIDSPSNTAHPLTFKPEFVNAFELGTKNTLLDGSLTLNADVFYYRYRNYQISQIVDRTAVNLNFNATVKGAELEGTWEPAPGLRFNAALGYEDATLNKGSQAIDLMDRTAGNSNWMTVKPFVTQTSNCVLPTDVVNQTLSAYRASRGGNNSTSAASVPGNTLYFDGDFLPLQEMCLYAYTLGLDPGLAGGTFTGFDPSTAPNNGEGFAKNLSGNKLPNTPPVTISLGAQYTIPVSEDWAGTLRGDFYWQGASYARIYNDKPYDQLRGYSTTNLALVFTNQDGWQAMAYVKNVFDTTAITGAFLNSDDTGLTTNVFTTDPRLMGVRITKNF